MVIKELASSLVCVLLFMCEVAGDSEFLECQTCDGPLASFSFQRYQQLIAESYGTGFADEMLEF